MTGTINSRHTPSPYEPVSRSIHHRTTAAGDHLAMAYRVGAADDMDSHTTFPATAKIHANSKTLQLNGCSADMDRHITSSEAYSRLICGPYWPMRFEKRTRGHSVSAGKPFLPSISSLLAE